MASIRYRTIKDRIFFYTICSSSLPDRHPPIYDHRGIDKKRIQTDQLEFLYRNSPQHLRRHARQRHGRNHSRGYRQRNHRNLAHGRNGYRYCHTGWYYGRNSPFGKTQNPIFKHYPLLYRPDSRKSLYRYRYYRLQLDRKAARAATLP